MKILLQRETEIDDLTIFLTLIELNKSYLLLFSDQKDMGIGTVTLGSPPIVEGLKSINASFSLFGIKHKLLSTILVEKASNLLKKPVLLLLFLKTNKNEEELAKPLVTFLDNEVRRIMKV